MSKQRRKTINAKRRAKWIYAVVLNTTYQLTSHINVVSSFRPVPFISRRTICVCNRLLAMSRGSLSPLRDVDVDESDHGIDLETLRMQFIPPSPWIHKRKKDAIELAIAPKTQKMLFVTIELSEMCAVRVSRNATRLCLPRSVRHHRVCVPCQ